MNRLEEDYSNQVKFVYLNAVQEGSEAFNEVKFRGHPALLLVTSDGDIQWRYQGAPSYQTMEEVLQDVLENP